jgi:hypothetical protein
MCYQRQRRNMGEQFVRHLNTASAQMPEGAVKIDGVPERDGCGEKGQSGSAMALVLECAVAQLLCWAGEGASIDTTTANGGRSSPASPSSSAS